MQVAQTNTPTYFSRDINSLYQLLKSRVFYKTDYASWLFHCMINASVPIHSSFGLLIKEFVTCVFLVDKLEKIPEEWIQPHFQDAHVITPSRILLTLYMLQFNDSIIAFCTDPKLVSLLSAQQQVQQQPYTIDVVHTIPLRAMLNYVESAQGAYHAIYPDLAYLTANMYPELLDVVSFLLYDSKMSSDHLRRLYLDTNDHKHIPPLDVIREQLLQYKDQPENTVKVLSRLQSVTLKDMRTYAKMVITLLLVPCLDRDTPSIVVDTFINTWEYYHLSIPHEIWLWTVNALNIHQKTYEFENLVISPLLIFQADRRIFRSKALLPLWLHILSCLRTSSKHRIWKRYHTVFSRNNGHINGRNVMALINAQDSVILQTLLELCHESDEDKNDRESLLAARKLVCRFIHGVFIDDRDSLLAKTFHFQTYSADLIPMMIEHVPSMYIVFNFLPELTRQPQIDKQVFGIILGCQLCEKYPMESYLALAEKCILPRLMKIAYPAPTSALAMTMSQHIQQQEQPQCVPSEYLLQTIPAFVHLARAFPHFSPAILKALHDIQEGLPGISSFVGQEGSNKIILLLQLHKTLKDTCEAVQHEADNMDSVNKPLLPL